MSTADRIAAARSSVMLSNVFFGVLVSQTPMLCGAECPAHITTAATDGKKVWFNDAFCEEQNNAQLVGLMLHEIWHKAGMHFLRRGNRDPYYWNVAGDLWINPLILRAGYKLPDGGLYHKRYATPDWSVEGIYDDITSNKEGRKAFEEATSGGSGDAETLGGIGMDILEPSEQLSEAEREEAIRQGSIQLAQAAQAAKSVGQLDAAIERLLEQFLDPQLPWEKLLHDFMVDSKKSPRTWARRNKRFRHVYLPGRKREKRLGEGIVIFDVSGSVSDEELQAVGSEVKYIWDKMNMKRLRVIYATTRVVKEDVFEPGDEFSVQCSYSGGTDMRVPLEYAEQYDPEFVILLSDCWTPWPDEAPAYPLLTVTTTDKECPHGINARLDLHT